MQWEIKHASQHCRHIEIRRVHDVFHVFLLEKVTDIKSDNTEYVVSKLIDSVFFELGMVPASLTATEASSTWWTRQALNNLISP